MTQTARTGEVAPPHDVSDITALLGGCVIMDVPATLVEAGKLGRLPQASGDESCAENVEEGERLPGG